MTEKFPPEAAQLLAGNTGYLLQAAHRKVRAAMDQALVPIGIDLKQLSVLGVVATLGPRTQRQLVDVLGMDKSVMVKVIDELEEQGLARRTRSDSDRRAYYVYLTEAGAERLQTVEREVLPGSDRHLAPLTAAERDQLNALLWKLVANP